MRPWDLCRLWGAAVAGLLSIGSVWAGTFRGVTEPVNDVTMSATVAGRVATILVREGESVNKGDVILELEKDEQELEMSRRKLIAESSSELESAKKQMDVARMECTATQELFKETKSVSEEEVWKKELDYKLAVGEYERVRVAKAREELEYKISAAQLEERILHAPFNGVIAKIHVRVGENANLQQPLVRIVDISRVRLITYVDSNSGIRISKGMKVPVRVDTGGGQVSSTGAVEFASPVVDPSSGLREIKLLFDNPRGSLQPGLPGVMVVEDKHAAP